MGCPKPADLPVAQTHELLEHFPTGSHFPLEHDTYGQSINLCVPGGHTPLYHSPDIVCYQQSLGSMDDWTTA